jgi:uncharacterized protein YkwD
MNRSFAFAGRIAVLALVLNLTACRKDSNSSDVATKSSTDSKANTESKSDTSNAAVAQSSNTASAENSPGEAPIISLEPPRESVTLDLESGNGTATPEPSEPILQPAAPTPSPTPSKPIEPSEPTTAVAPSTPEPPSAAGTTAQTASAVVAATNNERVKPSLGNVATDAELNQVIAADWPKPQVVLYVSGQQQGYLEPCGCTGLDTQKGGLIRRDTVLTSLRDRGWEVLPVDVGNQNRHKRSSGAQPQIKFETTAKALQQMGYKAVGLGVHDLELSRVELINVAASDPGSKPGSSSANDRPFISGNVVAYGEQNFFPAYKIVEAGGRKIGITSVIGKEMENEVMKPGENEIEFADPVDSLKKIVPDLKKQGCDFVVLLAHTTLAESAELGKSVEGIDLVVTAGGFGEPTLLPEAIADSKAVMVQVGTKGMYGGIVGLFDDPKNPIRYQKIAISSQFKDSERMLKQFAAYQDRLKEVGFKGLGLTPALHPTGRTFVGSETCGECHTQAYDVWKDTPHFHATDSIVAANNDRGGIERHYDPECVSCHVTGWNPQQFSPFQTGYADLEASKHLLGSGCENCHGPGSAHVEAESGSASTEEQKELRQEMILPLAKAEAKCMECHDFDNSPDFHAPGAFDKYWEKVKHYGKD